MKIMKITKKITAVIFPLVLAALFISCGSTATLDTSPKKEAEAPSGEIEAKGTGSLKAVLPPPPARMKEAPKFDFTGDFLQIEAENTYYDGFDLVGDADASKSYALKLLGESSWAIAEVNFPAGTYEGLACVLAPDIKHMKFNILINQDSYPVFGSEPPVLKYELTTRSVVSFTLDQPTTVTVKIQQNSANNPEANGHNGMTIDYFAFKKIK